MNANAWVSLGGAVVSLLAVLVTVIFSIRAGTAAKVARDVTIGAAETSLRQAISHTRHRVEDLSLQMADVLDGRRKEDLLAKEKRRFAVLESAFLSGVEGNLNAYEDACGKYNDNKIDRERFKKMYISEIQKLCEDKDSVIAEFIHPEGISKFKAIWKVYREWHIHET